MRYGNRHRQANGAHPARRKSASVDNSGSLRPLTFDQRRRNDLRQMERMEPRQSETEKLTAFLKEHPVDISKEKSVAPRIPAKRRMRG